MAELSSTGEANLELAVMSTNRPVKRRAYDNSQRYEILCIISCSTNSTLHRDNLDMSDGHVSMNICMICSSHL